MKFFNIMASPFAVINSTVIPYVLVELLFISMKISRFKNWHCDGTTHKKTFAGPICEINNKIKV